MMRMESPENPSAMELPMDNIVEEVVPVTMWQQPLVSVLVGAAAVFGGSRHQGLQGLMSVAEAERQMEVALMYVEQPVDHPEVEVEDMALSDTAEPFFEVLALPGQMAVLIRVELGEIMRMMASTTLGVEVAEVAPMDQQISQPSFSDPVEEQVEQDGAMAVPREELAVGLLSSTATLSQ